MPNTKSAKKELRKSKVTSAKNLAEKKNIKDLIKKISKVIETGKLEETKDLIKQFQKAVDKAVKRGWLKQNTGNRKKSRLVAKIKKSSVKK